MFDAKSGTNTRRAPRRRSWGHVLQILMTREELQKHLDSAAPRGGTEARRLASLIVGACWPGGPADRSERAALDWLRHWRPDQIHAELPECSCSTGHCVLCN